MSLPGDPFSSSTGSDRHLVVLPLVLNQCHQAALGTEVMELTGQAAGP